MVSKPKQPQELNAIDNSLSPPAQQVERDSHGRVIGGDLSKDTQFQPGISGNPGGRPSAGAAVKEWVNALHNHPISYLKSIIRDKGSPVNKIMAARRLLNATLDDAKATGKLDPGRDFDRVCDRTDGKPLQRVEAKIEHVQSVKEIRDRLLGKLHVKVENDN